MKGHPGQLCKCRRWCTNTKSKYVPPRAVIQDARGPQEHQTTRSLNHEFNVRRTQTPPRLLIWLRAVPLCILSLAYLLFRHSGTTSDSFSSQGINTTTHREEPLSGGWWVSVGQHHIISPSSIYRLGQHRQCTYHSFLLEAEQSAVPRTEAGGKPNHSAEGGPGQILRGRLGLPGVEGYS